MPKRKELSQSVSLVTSSVQSSDAQSINNTYTEFIQHLMHKTLKPDIFFDIMNMKGSLFYSKNGGSRNGRDNSNLYLFYILDIIRLKTLYLVEFDNALFLSPLNDKAFREQLYHDRNTNNMQQDYILDVITRLHNRHGDVIHPNDFDLIIRHGPLREEASEDISYEVTLSRPNVYVGSRISNWTHMIAISKCNGDLVLNSTWSRMCNVAINSDYFIPGQDQNYMMADSSAKLTLNPYQTRRCLDNIDRAFYKVPYSNTKTYNSGYYNRDNGYTTGNTHVFVSDRHKALQVEGNTSTDRHTYRAGERCSAIEMPVNSCGICWLISIVSVLFYPDIVSVLVIDKLNSKMPGILEDIRKSSEDILTAIEDVEWHGPTSADHMHRFIRDPENINRIHTNVVSLYAFINSSYFVMSKGQQNLIKNHKRWRNNLELISEQVYQIKIYLSQARHLSELSYDLM